MLALGTDASLNKAAAELGIPLDDARREHVANEQLRMVLVHTRVGTIAATLFALLAAATLSGSVPAAIVQAWVVVKVGVALARIGLAWLYRRRGMPGGRFWRRNCGVCSRSCPGLFLLGLRRLGRLLSGGFGSLFLHGFLLGFALFGHTKSISGCRSWRLDCVAHRQYGAAPCGFVRWSGYAGRGRAAHAGGGRHDST